MLKGKLLEPWKVETVVVGYMLEPHGWEIGTYVQFDSNYVKLTGYIREVFDGYVVLEDDNGKKWNVTARRFIPLTRSVD